MVMKNFRKLIAIVLVLTLVAANGMVFAADSSQTIYNDDSYVTNLEENLSIMDILIDEDYIESSSSDENLPIIGVSMDDSYEEELLSEEVFLSVDDTFIMVGVHPRTRTIQAVTMDENSYPVQIPESAWELEAILEAESYLVDVDVADYHSRIAGVNTDNTNISPRQIIGTDNRTRVANTNLAPYRSIAEIWVRWPNGSFTTSTGFFGNRNDIVITSGHVLYNPARGGWVSYISVFTSGGHFNGGWAWAGGSWLRNGNSDGDFGIIQLHQDTGVNVLPLRVLSNTQLAASSITVTGYPGDLSGMWRGPGRVREVWTHRFLHDGDTTGGNSGSPVYNAQHQVIGIHRGNVTRNEAGTANIPRMNDAITMNNDFVNWLRGVAF